MSNESKSVIFGEVLFDIFPDGSRNLGGAPFNVAWHCQAFGLNPLFISRIGEDEAGKEIKHAMKDWGMSVDGLQQDSNYPTGSVRVTFSDNEPSYDIVENSAWDYIDIQELPSVRQGRLLYHGSLSMRTSNNIECLSVLKKNFPGSTFVDVNLRSPWWNLAQIKEILHDAQWIKLNVDELDLIIQEGEDIYEKTRTLMSESEYKFIIVTRGSEGAIAFDKNDAYSVRPEPGMKLVDTVGAGDAFTSVLLLGLQKGWDLNKIITCGQEFANEIVGLHGAMTRDREFYKYFINEWKL